MRPRPGPVVFDLQATQSVDQRHRGIPRYVLELALALEEVAPEAVGAYILNPDLALPEAAERLVATGKLQAAGDVDWEAAGLLHLASPLEMTEPSHRQLPPAARAAGVPWVVTFYDLIPQLMPDYYLEDAGLRRRYRARLQLIRTAAAVLTLSEATRRDVVEHLGLDPRRVCVVGTGTGAQFVPPRSRSEAATAAAAAVPGLRPPFVFYIGSYERRKNLEPLLEAWSRLPGAVRARWQLALCCPLKAGERHHLSYRTKHLGISDSVLLTGFVPDDVLLLLHQGADLFVFPSLYEGYGLPVAEALACGAAVLAADGSSLPEIVGPEALFDASDPGAMAAAIERGLTDEGLRERLLGVAGRPPTTWAEVASATVAAYDRVLSGPLATPARRPGPAGRRSRLALVAPLPPDGGAVGEWNRRLVEELARRVEVHVFADRPAGTGSPADGPEAPPGVRVHPRPSLEAVEGLEGDFDAVVYSLADDEHHTGCLATLRRRAGGGPPAMVVVHDVRLAGVYGHAARSGALPEGLGGVIRAAYGEAVAPGVGDGGVLPAAEARRLGVLLARDVLAHTDRFLVTSEAHAALARLDAAPGDRDKVEMVGGDPAGVAEALTSGFSPPVRRPVGKAARRAGPVVFDLQATQSVDQRHRGISRYVLELALALEEVSPGHVGAYLINPDLALPEAAERLIATGKLLPSDQVDWDGVGLLHLGSLFEMGVPLHRLLPPAAPGAGVPWAVTFHDLIPQLMPDAYLEDPGRRRRYRARLPLVRTATAVLTNSRATRADAIGHLGLDPRRVVAVGTGTGARFVPPASRAEAAAAAAAAVPGLRPPFVFYVGNYEKRKNLEPLLEAWSLLDAGLRGRHTLVVCAVPDPRARHHLRHRATSLGVADSVLLMDFVPDDVLLLLHQGADLFVFPSLYEGYGLPVAEALACGAAVLAADGSSLPEIVGPEALFDASDPGAMAAAIERGLTDEGLRQRLLGVAGRPPTTWAEVAAATVAAYDRVLSGDLAPPGRRDPAQDAEVRRRDPAQDAGARRRRVALAAPLPPDGGPVGEWNRRLAEELALRVEVHAFADRPAGAGREVRPRQAPAGVAVHPLASLEAVEGLAGAFDAVVYSLADDEFHTGCLAALRRRAGRGGGPRLVVAHDVRLSDLYGHAARSGALPEGLGAVISSAYGKAVTPKVGDGGVLPAAEARRRGVLLAREALTHTDRLLVTSEAHAALVRLDAAPADRDKVAVVTDDPSAVAGALYSELTAGG